MSHTSIQAQSPIWHPCSQMKDYETFLPINVKSANGCMIELANGKKIIDAISSWWCKSLGHNHPQLQQAAMEQMAKFEHITLANTTNPTIANLSKQLSHLTDSLNKVFYTGDGSCAVEVALKMSLHARKVQGNQQRKKFVALQYGYHGETVGALSVSDVGLYREPYQDLLFETHFIENLPYVSGIHDPLWQQCDDHWQRIKQTLAPLQDTITAIIIEPIVQGAGQMRIYSQALLKHLRNWTKQHGIHLIADEIMTGMGRTGELFACNHAGIEPDFLCLSKGLTSGWLPFSVVLTRDDIYNIFYDDYASGKSFLHSHTYSGNALGASIALQVLTIFQQENILGNVAILADKMHTAMTEIAKRTSKLTNIRSIGAIIAADLICNDPHRRLGFEIYQKAVELGALLRPIGNTIYWLPPLNMSLETVDELKAITEQAILAIAF